MENQIKKFVLPTKIGPLLDFAPANGPDSEWLLLSTTGEIIRFNCDSCKYDILARAEITHEPDREPWSNRLLKQRLSSSPDQKFAAILNDNGKLGQIID